MARFALFMLSSGHIWWLERTTATLVRRQAGLGLADSAGWREKTQGLLQRSIPAGTGSRRLPPAGPGIKAH